jgi:tape measure domain-containing protein
MAQVTTDLKVVIRTAGDAGLDKLTRTLNGLGRQAKSAAAPFDQISKELKEVQSTSKNSIANLRGYRNAWRDITQQVEIGSAAFKEATAEAARLDKQLQKAEGRKAPGQGGRLAGLARGAGAIAAGGVFGGPEGALGGAAGLAVGGPAGAAIGAAIGAQVGQLRQALGATAEYSANLGKLRIALQGVTTGQNQYSDALVFIQKTTKDFAIPQDIITRQFTKLQASVLGAGGSIEDTKVAFNGIVAAVRATGGSLQDVDSALTATAQVFSKGKVSAEELRQQIGERLPGAFTLFAESIGKTPQELDKALEDGQVSLQDFQTFAQSIFERYGETAQIIASGPKSAGDQLQVELAKLKENLGTLLEPIGAAFQATFASIVTVINNAILALNNFLGIGTSGAINKAQRELDAATKAFEPFLGVDRETLTKGQGGTQRRFDRLRNRVVLATKRLEEAQAAGRLDIERPEESGGLSGITSDGTDPGGSQAKVKTTSQELLELALERNRAFAEGNKIRMAQLDFEIKIQEVTERFNNGEVDFNTAKVISLKAETKLRKEGLKIREDEKKAMRDLTKGQKEFKKELTETDKLVKSIESTLATSMASAIEGLIDGTKSLSESLSGVLRQMASLLLNFGTKSLIGGIFPSANGNVYANNKIVPFASGGVVNKPTIFPMANGMGLMGEAGPEAIMPLRRGANGKLGVEASGGGVGNVVVNVDASGSNVEGDQSDSKALGSAIGAAVQAELIKQKRPGGLLS